MKLFLSAVIIGLCMLLGGMVGEMAYLVTHKTKIMAITPAPPTPEETTMQHIQTGIGPVVRLVTGDGRTFCSGSVVGDQYVITAGHCIAAEIPFVGIAVTTEDIGIRAADGVDRGTTGRVVYFTPQLDHAVLKGNFEIYNKLNIIDDVKTITDLRNPKTNFVACGFPMGGTLFCTIVNYQGPEFFMWGITGILLPGMSGGPVMTPEGTQIGINDAVSQDHSVISPIYNIHGGM